MLKGSVPWRSGFFAWGFGERSWRGSDGAGARFGVGLYTRGRFRCGLFFQCVWSVRCFGMRCAIMLDRSPRLGNRPQGVYCSCRYLVLVFALFHRVWRYT